MKKIVAIVVLVAAVIVLLFTTSGGFLIVNRPEKADLIVVLAGETDRRPARGLEMLAAGYAPRILVDV
ncbi:MAG TPA: hypothetical protein VF447_10885, partial [Terriglobales bacterium]